MAAGARDADRAVVVATESTWKVVPTVEKRTHVYTANNFLLQFLTDKQQQTLANIEMQVSRLDNVIWRRYSTDHVQRLWRMLPVLAVAPTERANFFEQIAEEMDWGPRTRDTYWASCLSMASILNMEILVEDRALSHVLQKQAAEAPSWDLEQEGTVLTEEQIIATEQLAVRAPPAHPIRAAYISLVWGQRVGDVLKLTPMAITKMGKLTENAARISATFTEGKTIGKMGPYTLSVAITHPMATLLWESAQAAVAMGRNTLFDNSTKEITAMLGKVDLRAFRRTGLTRMSMAGAEVNTLLSFSRHATVKMLEVYLMRGLFNEAVATQQMNITSKVEALQSCFPTMERPQA